MLGFIRDIFFTLQDTSSFMPRWYCGNWTALHGWTHIISDILIGGAYMAIPISIFFLALRRPDVPFPRIFWLFGAFIIACGSTHFIEAIIFWHPVYRVSALAKVATAVISWLTVLALIDMIPQALRYPGLEALNRKLQQANEDLEDFANVVSHDLRAPLRGIHRVSQWLEESIESADGETKEHLELLRNRADKMDKLIDGVLLYSRAGLGNVSTTSVDTRAVVEDVMLSLSPEQRSRMEVLGEFPVVEADDIQVYQIFQNLIENALRYTNKPGGRVAISARKGERQHEFTVEDNGPGIPEDERERIFRVFHTTETVSSTHAGLGLAIARKVLERNGGKIWVEPRPEGGSKFIFTWPVRAEAVRHSFAMAAESGAA